MIAKVRRAWIPAALSLILAVGLTLSQVLPGAWALPTLTYGIRWSIEFWYMVPPWTAINNIWAFFGLMVYGPGANQWLGYSLTCVFYAVPYLIGFLILRVGLSRAKNGVPTPIRAALQVATAILLAVWIVVTLTGIAAWPGRGMALLL